MLRKLRARSSCPACSPASACRWGCEKADALLVPDQALGADQSGKYLLVVDKDNVVQQRTVQTGQLVGQLRVITSGITADDLVVVSGNQRAVAGEKIEPRGDDDHRRGAASRQVVRRRRRPMISKFFIERPVLANVLAIVIVLIGGVALFTAAGRAISECRAADRVGHHPLSRRQRQHRDEHRRPADRAAGQRRAGHALHAVDQCVGRHLFAERDLRDRHRPEFRAGAGAEPRFRGDGVAAAGGAGAGRDRAAEVHLDPADRHADRAGRALRQPVPEQLRHHQPGAGTVAPAWRGQCQRVRRRAVFHAHLAGSAGAAGARSGAEDVINGDPAAEPAGDRGPDRRTAGTRRTGLPVHGERRGTAGRSRRVRQHHRQGRHRRMAGRSRA